MKHPTEKDRVRKVVERAFNQIQFYGINVPDRIKNVEYFTRLILKEIKRAERREREACEKVAFDYRQNMCDYIRQASKTHKPHFVADCKYDAADSLYKAIRNRRKV